jgi:PilZ domain-containing protein
MVATALQNRQPLPETPEAARDQRGDRRMRVFKTARIVFNGGYTAADCRVKNLSLSGALLEMPSIVGVPNQFELQLDGVQRSSKVVWRNDRFLGVVFAARGPAAVGQ